MPNMLIPFQNPSFRIWLIVKRVRWTCYPTVFLEDRKKSYLKLCYWWDHLIYGREPKTTTRNSVSQRRRIATGHRLRLVYGDKRWWLTYMLWLVMVHSSQWKFYDLTKQMWIYWRRLDVVGATKLRGENCMHVRVCDRWIISVGCVEMLIND